MNIKELLHALPALRTSTVWKPVSCIVKYKHTMHIKCTYNVYSNTFRTDIIKKYYNIINDFFWPCRFQFQQELRLHWLDHQQLYVSNSRTLCVCVCVCVFVCAHIKSYITTVLYSVMCVCVCVLCMRVCIVQWCSRTWTCQRGDWCPECVFTFVNMCVLASWAKIQWFI